MNKKQHFKQILDGTSGKSGYWHGHPHVDAEKFIYDGFGVHNDYELTLKLGSNFFWALPHELDFWDFEKHAFFDVTGGAGYRRAGMPENVFKELEDYREVDNMYWPDPWNCDFTRTMEYINRAGRDNIGVCSGNWSQFFHVCCDIFGMEDYFCKMYTDPMVVEAVTEKVVDFYLRANEILFDLAGDSIDCFFFGNDFGTQLDLMISTDCFDRFILPYYMRIVDAAKRRGYKVAVHSCGAIDKVIPKIIDAGVDVIHPIQAKAKDMQADRLQEKYGGKVIFMGGVDTQELLPYGRPDQIREEVLRLREIFGNNFIVSPSHESIVLGVPTENIIALRDAAME